jgi:hypothetical protein
MNMSIGPFNLIFFVIIIAIIYIAGFYFTIKNKLGIVGFLTILFFPLIGSLGIIMYSLNKKAMRVKKYN